jgi:CDP-diacylglycerol---glycerol-3-phosphate 3-phosphatidyltransferase
MSIYLLKPAFQALLRPSVRLLHRGGVSANAVTLFACGVSVALGLLLYLLPVPRMYYLAIPVWMALRMALNAMDGMLAREFGQATDLGAFLNELTDVVSDAALLLPFANLFPGNGPWLAAWAVLAGLSEMAGVMGQAVGSERRYDGPMGKSDRAAVLGILALLAAWTSNLPAWLDWLFPILVALIALTIVNRVQGALAARKP